MALNQRGMSIGGKALKSWVNIKLGLTSKKEFPAALEFLSGPLVMYPNDYYGKVGPEGMALKPVGTGPYAVTSVEPGKRYRFKKYDGHHNGSPKGKANIGNVDSYDC